MEFWNEKKILITGATDGLGEFITRKLLESEYHIKVIAFGRRDIEDSYLRNYKDKSLYVQVDFNDIESLKRKVKKIIKEFGPIDIVINNACHFEVCNVLELDYQAILTHFNVNTYAPLFITQEFIKSMVINEYGKVIMINTESALQVRPEIAAYASSKTALLNLSRALAQSVKHSNVTVNSLLLGPLATNYYLVSYQNEARKRSTTQEEVVGAMINKMYPFNTSEKLTSLEAVFDTIEFICKSEINGVSWRLDGGSLSTIF